MNKIIRKIKRGDRGYFLVSAIVMILFLTGIAFAISELATVQYQHAKREVFAENAQLAAEAGIEQTVHQLNTDDSFAGYATPQVFFDNADQGRGTFASTITDNGNDSSKTIVSTGTLYRNSSDSSPYITRKVRVTVVGTESEGYSVYSGPGGLILGGSATITNTEVYVNGTLTLSGAAKIGTATNPVTVNVANIACPTGNNPGPSYPQSCGNTTQPITMGHSTRIYGTVCATGQTSTGPNNNIQGGNGGSGLQVGCTAPPVSQPPYNRQAHISAVSTTGSGSSNTYVCSNSPFARTWPGNLQLNGNVTIGTSCDVTINGNVYISGNLTINGASKIRVADSLGTTRPTVMVDGNITVGGSASMLANSSGTGIHFISVRSNASCNPNCTSLSGTELKTSQGLETISVGGNVNVPGMIFQAYWGKVSLSGSGNVGSAVGQTVDLSGAGTVIFGTALASGTKTWAITSYQQLYSP